jgi:hypothetical protein
VVRFGGVGSGIVLVRLGEAWRGEDAIILLIVRQGGVRFGPVKWGCVRWCKARRGGVRFCSVRSGAVGCGSVR